MEFGVYVHIPWCRARCPYCAFPISVRRDRPHEATTDAVLREWEHRRARFGDAPPSTLFFGGGTPSLTPPGEIARMIRGIAPGPGAEISLEANPHDLDAATLDGLREAGINRLSVGVQGFDPRTAARLGRRQDAAAAPDVLRRARGAGFRSLSLDLIFGVPGQSLEDWGRELDTALSFAPDHVSLYGLTIEEGTPFAVGGRVHAAEDDAWRDLYDLAVDRLGAAGLPRYEVSNFARTGHRCRHNEHYWQARPWAGLGVGAHGWEPDGTRTVNLRDVDAYLAAEDPTESRERPAPEVLAIEILASGLRHVDGLDRRILRAYTGLDVRVPPTFVQQGLVALDGDILRLCETGFAVVDALATRLSGTLSPVPRDSTRDSGTSG